MNALNIHMPDLRAERFDDDDDGILRLTQRDYCGEEAVIALHVTQLRTLAEAAGLLRAQPVPPANHARRLRALWDRIREFHDEEAYFNQIFDRCEDGAEIWLHIRAIHEQCGDLVDDLDTAADEAEPGPPPPEPKPPEPPKRDQQGDLLA